MMHAMADTLLADLDGELPPVQAQELAKHLAGCTECAARAARLRKTSGLFGAALLTIDSSEPASWSLGRTRADGAVERVIPLQPHGTATRIRWWGDASPVRRAAALLLVTAAAASAAVLGGRALGIGSEPPAPLTVTPAPAQPTVATVAVPPEDGRVQITLTGAGSGTRVTVVLTDAVEATVSIEGVAPHVTAARSEVAVGLNGRAAVVRLALPADLREADVIADGARVIRMRDGRVTPAAALTEGIVIGSRPLTDP